MSSVGFFSSQSQEAKITLLGWEDGVKTRQVIHDDFFIRNFQQAISIPAIVLQ
jgi:hypothetical protein